VFEDPLVAFGGGVDLFANPHVAIRPEVQVLVVTSESTRRWVGVYAVTLAYHFEPHAVR
jgi:hypothetical protein